MRVFLDANVFIWALWRPQSNSARIVELALAGRLDAVVDGVVVEEVSRNVKAGLGRSEAWVYREQIRRRLEVIPQARCIEAVSLAPEDLKQADRLHLAATRLSGADFLVAYDADFNGIPEYVTPNAFVRRIGKPVAPTEW